MPQPTKLKTPVKFEFADIENVIAMIANNERTFKGVEPTPSERRCMDIRPLEPIIAMLECAKRQLTVQGIDYRTWEPPQPFKIGAHETTFNPNGSIKVGCTDIERATLVEVLKRSDEAMKGEGEWPKYYQQNGGIVYRCVSDTDYGQYFEDGRWKQSCPGPLVEHAQQHPNLWKKLTRAEACAILGRDV